MEIKLSAVSVFLRYYRSHAVSAETKLYAALRFYAAGTFQHTVGDLSGISQSSVSRIVKQVSLAIAMLRDEFIYMPRNNAITKYNLSFHVCGASIRLFVLQNLDFRLDAFTEKVYISLREVNSLFSHAHSSSIAKICKQKS